MARLIERSLEYELQERLVSNPSAEVIIGYSPSMLLKKRILSDLILLLNNNHDNRRLIFSIHIQSMVYIIVISWSW